MLKGGLSIDVVLLSEVIFLTNKCGCIVIFIFCFTLFHFSGIETGDV